MEKIVLYTKSYSKDLDRLAVSLESIKKHNVDNIPYYVSVPKYELDLFKNSLGTDYVNFVADEDIYFVESQNWKTQQIVKSNFWKLGFCENYLMMDSDSYFIKDFRRSDFIHDSGIPYTVMHEQKDLFEWSFKNKGSLGFDPYEGFCRERKAIMEVFGRVGKVYDFGPGPIIWNTQVWKSLEENYLLPNNLKFSNLIEFMPSEFSWYGEYFLISKAISLYPIEPLFKFFHFSQQYSDYKKQGYVEEDFTQQYFGIVMQSNWNAPLKY